MPSYKNLWDYSTINFKHVF